MVFESERLVLRELTVEDAKNFYLLNENPLVIKYTGDPAFEKLEDAEEFLIHYSAYRDIGYGRWAVIEKSSNKFLGWCGLKYDPAKDETDIGFRFFQKYWNKGYATEAALATLDYGFMQLKIDCIVGRAMKENIASTKVLEKIGMGEARAFDFEGNEGSYYSLLKTDYEKGRRKLY